MQKQQVFKVKGMQRDLSMANANGEFAYEIVNMRLIPAEENQGFSLTNEQGTTHVATGITGTILGQCATTNSLIVFTTCSSLDENGEIEKDYDYIYCIRQNASNDWEINTVYEGNLNFHPNYKIEALFNYETEDIQKIYWIDGYNQLRCINVAHGHWPTSSGNDTQFDSVKEINSLPNVEIERVSGGNFVAGVLQYYVTYFNEFGTESPIVYTSPLLYLAHSNRGANVNDKVSTAFKLILNNLDTTNWGHIRVYATHRTSLEATPEGSIVTEIKIPEESIEFIDYGTNRISIAPSDLYFTGSKFVKVGTMTVKDQVMFLGNLDIQTAGTLDYTAIKELFDGLRTSEQIDNFFSTETRKQTANDLVEYQDTYYTYNNQLNNTESITHYKYGEKYRFGISVMDKYGVWSNPIWIKDEFILTPPEQINGETLELPCPTLNLSGILENGNTLWEELEAYGAVSIKPLVVFPKEEERKVIAQGVVCPTVYNLKDRKENGPYAQASWFMRPNAPADLWGVSSSIFGKFEDIVSGVTKRISHKSDLMTFDDEKIATNNIGYFGAAAVNKLANEMTGYDYLYDDFSTTSLDKNGVNWNSKVIPYSVSDTNLASQITDNESITLYSKIEPSDQELHYKKGSWVEFRHNYALRSKGWSFGYPSNNSWNNTYFTEHKSDNNDQYPIYYNIGMVRGAELDTSRFDVIPPVNRFIKQITQDTTGIKLDAEYVKEHDEQLYFATIEDPKTVHEKRQAEEDVSLFVLFVHNENGVEYVHLIDTIKIPFKATIGTLPTVYGSPNVFINISNKTLDPNADKHKKFLKLKARADSSITSFKNGERNYYVWEIRGASEIKLEDYIDNYMKETTMYFLNSESQNLFFGKKPASNFSLGNASYYVDNSIITLNSPEIELKDFSLNIENSKFRITGLIPLTATSSDISLEVEAPSMDPFSLGAGLIKRTYSNTNIGYHGFKGIVGSNAYLTSVNDDTSYSLVPLHPWQTTGTLGKHDNTSDTFKTKDTLKKKILSNLRYSASTYFFNPDSLQFKDSKNNNNKAKLKEKVIGWKPSSSCDVQVFNSEDTSTIIKLNSLNYTTQSLVYKGNIDSIAMLIRGNTNTLYENPIYSFRDNPLADNTDLDPALRMNSPAAGSYSKKDGKGFYKEAQGSSIKYKSSPHFVIGFSCLAPLWGSSQRIQETLPAWRYLNEEGISDINYEQTLNDADNLEYGQLYEDANIASLYHQDYICLNYNESLNTQSTVYNLFRKSSASNLDIATPNYGWLWLGEIYRDADPTFGGEDNFALENNSWEVGGQSKLNNTKQIDINYSKLITSSINVILDQGKTYERVPKNAEAEYELGNLWIDAWESNTTFVSFRINYEALCKLQEGLNNPDSEELDRTVLFDTLIISNDQDGKKEYEDIEVEYQIIKNEQSFGIQFFTFPQNDIDNFTILDITGLWPIKSRMLMWTTGDTYYQRFDTLKTYAHDEAAQNSIIDITSFMVETRVNIDGRYDRNRGQESNLQMSPTNFNLINDVYSQKDNFFTYRILDDDVQARTKFPTQITWSLSKTAGETIDSWMNITMASILNLDGTKGKLTALKTFNNNIIALQDRSISTILFNSRVQIPTSENVPIQIANSGKVDGQQIIMGDVGCQDKWSVVTTSQGLYFVDYYNKAIYRFTGKIEDLSLQGGFRGWCNKYINEQSQVVGYYDIKNKEVMFNDPLFESYNSSEVWLGFSELSNSFSSFYTYPYGARLVYINGIGVWLHDENAYTHQTGNYNELIYPDQYYGLIVCARQDSNTVKTFNNVEFRADTYPNKEDTTPFIDKTFDTISIETETEVYKSEDLVYHKYLPSNLKKKLRTWRANIPRVNGSAYKKFVNQWAKVGLWKYQPEVEKTILHDLAVIYTD